MGTEEQIRQAYVEVKVLESYAEEIRTRLQVVLTTTTELQTTRTAIEELAKTAEGTPLLVNLGGGVYGMAKLADRSKILIDVGTGVVVEKTVDGSLEIINKRLEELDKARASLESQLSNILVRLDKSRGRLSELSTATKETSSRR
ncbi:MAG: prefoldin subunit alpha [Candidatus Brockarchaeota archaeon]|nr:prefoldin subunit alpha [Candidatus Brockarchaeota archaeon]